MVFFEKEIKKLGFGLMRLPRKDDAIDVEQVKEMVDRFMAAGFTYFDTAWAYAGSEDAIRQALVERYPRESFQLATKNAAWIGCKTREDAVRQFEESLARTGAGYFDNYLLHNLGEGRTKFFDDFELWEFVKEKKAEGKIRHIGFSFHSTPEELEAILQAHPEAGQTPLRDGPPPSLAPHPHCDRPASGRHHKAAVRSRSRGAYSCPAPSCGSTRCPHPK